MSSFSDVHAVNFSLALSANSRMPTSVGDITNYPERREENNCEVFPRGVSP